MYFVSSEFDKALVASIRDVTMRLRMVELTTASGSYRYKTLKTIDGVMEGTVYVDTERAMRRTSQMRILNPDGTFTPEKPGDDFYWDGVFQLDYGLRVGDEYLYHTCGTFMVDRTEVLAEKEASVLNIDGSDLWKKLQKSSFALPKAYFVNSTYNSVITDMANDAGIYNIHLDSLTSRATTEKQLQAPLYFEIEDNRGDKLWELCEKWNLDIWFDVYGTLRTRDRAARISEVDNTAPVWTLAGGEEATFLNITKERGSDTIYNHYVVLGEGDDGNPVVVGQAIDGLGTTTTGVYYTNSATSPTSVEAIGDRVKFIRTSEVRTTVAARAMAEAELAKGSSVEESIRIPSIVIPHFEGFDVIAITEPTHTKTNDKYFLKRFDIPMRSGSQQEINVSKLRGI